MLLPGCSTGSARNGRGQHRELVGRIRADGWPVENYQFPLIANEQRAGSTMLQCLALIDVRTDREVWVIYSSIRLRMAVGCVNGWPGWLS